jgi:hypothetical protein
MSDDLAQMAQPDYTVTLGTRVITVREVRMKHLGAFTRACAPFLKEFDHLNPEDEFALFKVISEHAEAMVVAASLVSDAPKEFLEQLKPDDFFKIGAKVIQVNGNFFVRQLAPQLIKFAQGMSLVGTMLSSASSEPGTPSPE